VVSRDLHQKQQQDERHADGFRDSDQGLVHHRIHGDLRHGGSLGHSHEDSRQVHLRCSSDGGSSHETCRLVC